MSLNTSGLLQEKPADNAEPILTKESQDEATKTSLRGHSAKNAVRVHSPVTDSRAKASGGDIPKV